MRRLSTKGGTREGGRGDLDRYLVDVRRYFSQKKTVESAEQSQQAAGRRRAGISERDRRRTRIVNPRLEEWSTRF